MRAHGKVTQAQLDGLRDGITVDGIRYGPIEATLDREQGSNVWLTFAMREGKNREVRNVLGHLGLQVARLIRVSFGPFQLGDLPRARSRRCRRACCASSSARRSPGGGRGFLRADRAAGAVRPKRRAASRVRHAREARAASARERSES